MLGESSAISLSAIAGVVAIYWLLITAYNFWTAPQPPKHIPWKGYGKGWIAGLRNFFATSKGKEWLVEGYEEYSKKNKVFVLPATLGMQAEVVMPPEQLSWMFDQPDSVLGTKEGHYDFLQGKYSFVDPFILRDPYHEHVIHKNLVRNLNLIIPDLEEEVPPAVEAIYGNDTENWKSVDALESFLQMIPRLTNHLLMGPELCREQKYLDPVIAFTKDIMQNATIMLLVPKAFHPVLGRLLGCISSYHYRQSAKYTLPFIKKRLEDFRKKEAGDPEYKDWQPPHDFVTWQYLTACSEGRMDEIQPERIAMRVMPLNFAANHTTSMTAFETFKSILTTDPKVIESLREEAHRILQEEGGWTKEGLRRMYRMDSMIRESQRASPIALTFIGKKVVAKEGVVTPEGIHLEYGTLVTCPWMPIALDEDFHENAKEFDAFRYSRPREEFEAMSLEDREGINTLRLKQKGLVTTTNIHLPFGNGRHACPGRFFVAHELKMIFAYLLLNYDFKPLPKQPETVWVIRFQVPSPPKIEFKRRKTVWQPNSV